MQIVIARSVAAQSINICRLVSSVFKEKEKKNDKDKKFKSEIQ